MALQRSHFIKTSFPNSEDNFKRFFPGKEWLKSNVLNRMAGSYLVKSIAIQPQGYPFETWKSILCDSILYLFHCLNRPGSTL
jgi:hypothetical protein